ncbi:MAG: type I restriction enzyme HsdR N-terminal domain-containing protein [Deltaproteobacteria bacterium]|nr:type I restriction enzyme HsdR N-terminal domain-containing protein [Deltaproteobacteria bacterium]
MAIPKKVAERLVAGIKKFQPVIANAKARDVNESDTVMLATDLLADVFGYGKYDEVTSEYAIKSTYCDLAIKLDGVLQLLIEVKAIGLELKDAHVKQAVDYAANQGAQWVVLTNAEIWRVFNVTLAKSVEAEQVLEINFSALNPKSESDLELLYTLSKEGWQKSALGAFHEQKQALSRFSVAAIVQSEAVVNVIRKELRAQAPDIRIEPEQILDVLRQEVLKRDVIEGEKADAAKKKVARVAKQKAARKAKDEDDGEEAAVVAPAPTEPPAAARRVSAPPPGPAS